MEIPAHKMTTAELDPLVEDTAREQERQKELNRLSFLLVLGWLGTNLGYSLADLPLRYLLKDDLKRSAQEISTFFAIGVFTNYIKPVAGIFIDSVPLFGTRRRHYLLWSLTLCGLGWALLGLVPRTYNSLLITYTCMYFMVVVISTTLGGVMVEVGTRYRAAGRLTAQRVGMFRLAALVGGPLGGWLATYPFGLATGLTAGMHLILVPLFFVALREPSTARTNRDALLTMLAQFRGLVTNRPLLAAAGMICLIAIEPGFGTPLFFHQNDVLKFSKPFIGSLGLISAACGLIGAAVYYRACRNLNLRVLLAISILIHAAGTLFYLAYHSRTEAILITALSGFTGTLAMLPVYDLAARGTPRGSEALGYSVMMSVWNLTNAWSDWSGSTLYSRFHWTFLELVWLNSGTTLIALLAVPFLPAVLVGQRDGTK